MRKSLLNVFVLGVVAMEGNSYSAESKECQVPFKFDSSKINSKAVDSCVEVLKLQAASQETLQIVGSATPEGTTEYNDKLSKRRAENLRAALVKRVPELKVEARGVGEIPENGLIARIVVEPEPVTESQAVAQETINREELTASVGTSDVSPTITESPSYGGRWRVGPRLGQDQTRIEDEEEYFAPGLDIAYVPLTGVPNLRVEIGAIGNIYMDGDEQQYWSAHFAPLVGYQSAGGYIVGVRGLAGVIDSDITDDRIDDTGAELRLGREAETWSAFLGAGQTKALNRIGLDIGYRF